MLYPAYVCVVEGPPGTGETWFCVNEHDPHSELAEAERDAIAARAAGMKVLRIDRLLGKGVKEIVKTF